VSTVNLIGRWYVGGVLTDCEGMTLSDPAAGYGVKRDDTGVVLVAAGTAMSRISAGTYRYILTTPQRCLRYTYWMRIVHAGAIYHVERKYLDDQPDGSTALQEQILAWIAAAINGITVATGHGYNLVARRPQGLQPDNEQLADGMVYVFAGTGEVGEVTLDGAATAHQEVICRIVAEQRTGAGPSVDTRLLQMLTDVAGAVIGSNTGQSACGGIATQAEIRDWTFADGDGVSFLIATFDVEFACKWDDFAAVP
jgi:hypothetical protein